MKQNNFHKKHINKWLVFILCVAFTLQLFAVPMLALAENMENVPGSDTSAAGQVLPEPSASASSGTNDSARQAQKPAIFIAGFLKWNPAATYPPGPSPAKYFGRIEA